jgi:hypothetical protein
MSYLVILALGSVQNRMITASTPDGIKTMHKPLKILAVLPTLLLLNACGDGSLDNDDDSAVTPPVAIPVQIGGIWRGTVIEDGNTLTPRSVVIYTTDSSLPVDNFRLTSNFANQVVGNVSLDPLDNTQLLGDGLVSYAPQDFFISDGAVKTTCDITATLQEATSLVGRYSCLDGGTGDITVAYDALYEFDSSLSLIEGLWGNGDIVFEVDSTGNIISWSDTNGCAVTGSIELLDPNFNMYNMSLTIDDELPSNCQLLAGFYTGLAIISTTSGRLEITFQVDNGSLIITELVIAN